jgi:hypothetical protein
VLRQGVQDVVGRQQAFRFGGGELFGRRRGGTAGLFRETLGQLPDRERDITHHAYARGCPGHFFGVVCHVNDLRLPFYRGSGIIREVPEHRGTENENHVVLRELVGDGGLGEGQVASEEGMVLREPGARVHGVRPHRRV